MTGWMIETFVATTLLMLLVLAIRGPVCKTFGPNIAYALWLLPVARLFMPALPGNWQLTRLLAPLAQQAEEAPGITMGLLNTETMPAAAADAALWQIKAETAGHVSGVALVPPTVVEGGPSVVLLLAILWATGAAIFLAYHLIAHSRFCRRLLRRARIDRTVAEGRVRVIETDAAHGPLAFGIWRKYVAFPRDFSERYDEVERNLALAHELGHHVRGDLLANWVALIVLALHWFNPVAWRAFRAFRADQEMACDALVLAGRAQALRHAYGRAIVKSAHGGAVSAACHLHTINELKGRLRMLSKTKKYSPIRVAAGCIGVGAVALAGLGLTASGTQAAENLASRIEASTGISINGQDVPAPPAPADVPEVPKVEKHVRVITDGEGADGKHKKVIVVRRGDGGVDTIAMPEIPEMPELAQFAQIETMIPDISSANCKDGDAKQMVRVIPGTEGKQKQRIIICTNRIEAQAEMAAKQADKYAKMGLQSALVGLKHARKTIEMDTELSAEKKADALKGIDEAIAELHSEIAKAN